MTSTDKPHAPSCERNRDAILELLSGRFADRKWVLEIGSGTAQHAVHFAEAMPHLSWQTSDLAHALAGMGLWLDEAGLPNTPTPIVLDVRGLWPTQRYDAIFSANTLHIFSWAEVKTLFERLPDVLQQDATIAIYGPLNYRGQFTSTSNAQFNDWLQERGTHMAIRDFEAVDGLAQSIGLHLLEDYAMPANNRLLIWRSESTQL